MRLIDADALTKEIKQDIADEGLTERFVFYRINEAPSIDIVRCGECKWRKAKMMPKSVKCLFSGKDDDFCSYGEREDE